MAKTTTSLTLKDVKTGNSARGPWALTIFSGADGNEYSTFKGELASKVNSLEGKALELEYSPGRDPVKYPNSYTLEGVEAAGAGEVAVVVSETPTPAPYAETTISAAPSKNDQFRTKEQIMRTDALQATLTLFGIIGLDPLSGVDEFVGWFDTLYKLIEQDVFETPDVRVGV